MSSAYDQISGVLLTPVRARLHRGCQKGQRQNSMACRHTSDGHNNDITERERKRERRRGEREKIPSKHYHAALRVADMTCFYTVSPKNVHLLFFQ